MKAIYLGLALSLASLAQNVNGQSPSNSAQNSVPKPDGAVAGEAQRHDDKGQVTDDELKRLKQQLDEQQRLLQEQQRQLEKLRVELENKKTNAAQSSDFKVEPAVNSTNTSPEVANSTPAGANASPSPAPPQTENSPLSFRIGSAYITPVGFMDFTFVGRTTNLGSGIGTNFGSIPFSNTTQGQLTEARFSAQNSRFGFRVDAKVKGANVIGYLESDFLGGVPTNVAVTSNSDPLRLRLYWVDVRKGKLEVLGGQSWSMLTPGRSGISPLPGDLFYSQVIDTNYQAGLTWTRQPQFRVVYHAAPAVTFGVSLENPEQYIGGSSGGSLVTLPSNNTALSTALAAQLDNGNTSLNTPNLHPDIVAKLAFDPKIGGHSLHFEVGGVFSSFKLYNPTTQQRNITSGGGGQININYELFKNFHILTNNYYSDGGGRYIFGQAPDLIVRSDGTASLVHSASTVSGIETQVTKSTLFYAYYGGIYIQRNVSTDSNGHLIGYGYLGSPSSQNRAINEGTFGLTQTIWKDPKYGALQLMGQYSYLSRNPWFVATGQPADAHLSMYFINLRYSLPGSAPAKVE